MEVHHITVLHCDNGCYYQFLFYQKQRQINYLIKSAITFNIRPILSDKCFKCHGPDANKRQAQLRLDIADSAFAPLKETKGAFALVPGKPDESELYKRISSH